MVATTDYKVEEYYDEEAELSEEALCEEEYLEFLE